MVNYRVVYRLDGYGSPMHDFFCAAENGLDATDKCREAVSGAQIEAVYFAKENPPLTDEQYQLLYIEISLDRMKAEKDNDDAKEDECLDQLDDIWKKMSAIGIARVNHMIRTIMYLTGDITEMQYLSDKPPLGTL